MSYPIISNPIKHIVADIVKYLLSPKLVYFEHQDNEYETLRRSINLYEPWRDHIDI